MSSQPMVGGDVVRLITAGMYDDPLVIYREYLQNAADSVASLGRGGGTVTVSIDPLESRVTITDDGAGLPPRDAASRLVGVGNSTKNPAVDRGRRGVGRLAALAFAEDVHFTTRSRASESVTRVSWHGRVLREMDLERIDAVAAVEACTTIKSLPDDSWPSRFFHVSVDGVTRHAASTVLNQDLVRSYISEVCPVPFGPPFPLAVDINDFLSRHTEHFVMDVFLDGAERPIKRPFGKAIPLTDSYAAPFEQLEKRHIPQIDGDSPAAVLWLAHTPYSGSIPRRLGVRGLRARVGNIQIGSDDIFSHLFLETRFNGWCVGEVHILDSRIVPNARRDYFELGPHLRNLENHIGAIAQEVSSRCRSASSHRNRLRGLKTAIEQLKCSQDLAVSGYLRPEDAAMLLARAREAAPKIRRTVEELEIALSNPGWEELALRIDQLETVEPGRSFAIDGLPSEAVETLRSAFGAVVDEMAPDSALGLIESIVRRLSGR